MSRRLYKTSIVKPIKLEPEHTSEGVELKITQPPFLYKVKVIHSSLRKRQSPSTNAPIIGIISDQGIYTICNEENEWG